MRLHHATLEFLRAINEHNSRKFFGTIRPLYDEIWENLNEVCQELITQIAKIDPDYAELQPKDCLFRIYRDARRLKDGDPIYKNNFGMAIAPGGKKSQLPGFYLHIQGENQSFFGGGIYRPSSEQLYNLRSYLREHGDEYKKLVSDKKFKKFFGEIQGSSLTRPPRGFNHYDNHLDLIMRKQHLIYSPISDKDLLEKDIIKLCMERVDAGKEWMDLMMVGCTTKANK